MKPIIILSILIICNALNHIDSNIMFDYLYPWTCNPDSKGVYFYVNNSTNKIEYIGRTIRNFGKRFNEHLKSNRNFTRNTYKKCIDLKHKNNDYIAKVECGAIRNYHPSQNIQINCKNFIDVPIYNIEKNIHNNNIIRETKNIKKENINIKKHKTKNMGEINKIKKSDKYHVKKTYNMNHKKHNNNRNYQIPKRRRT